MRIPTSFSLYLKSFLGFIAAKYIFNRTRHHVVNSRQSIGRRRAFKKHEWWIAFASGYAFLEYVCCLPKIKYFRCNCRQVKSFVFSKFYAHFILFLNRCAKVINLCRKSKVESRKLLTQLFFKLLNRYVLLIYM